MAAEYLKGLGYKDKVYVVGSSGVTKELDKVGLQYTGVGVSEVF